MTDRAMAISGRLSDPSITSVIFAPKPQNYGLSSVTTQLRIVEAVPLASLIDAEELISHRIAEHLRRQAPEIQVLITKFLLDYFDTSFTPASVKLRGEIACIPAERVPSRDFPFVSHLNLLGPAVEGLSFDLDDFLEE